MRSTYRGGRDLAIPIPVHALAQLLQPNVHHGAEPAASLNSVARPHATIRIDGGPGRVPA